MRSRTGSQEQSEVVKGSREPHVPLILGLNVEFIDNTWSMRSFEVDLADLDVLRWLRVCSKNLDFIAALLRALSRVW